MVTYFLGMSEMCVVELGDTSKWPCAFGKYNTDNNDLRVMLVS